MNIKIGEIFLWIIKEHEIKSIFNSNDLKVFISIEPELHYVNVPISFGY